MPDPIFNGGKRQPGAESQLRGLFEELAFTENQQQGLLSFCKHAGIFIPAVAADVWPAFLSHYRRGSAKKGQPDINRVASDLATWGPIAARVAEIRRKNRTG